MPMTFLSKFSKRERIILGGGCAFIGVVALYLYFIAPMQDRAVMLDKRIAQTTEALKTLEGFSEEYQYRSTQTREIESRLPGPNAFSPLSYIEQVATKNNVRNKIASMRAIPSMPQGAYREIPMEVKMEALSISKLVPFLAAFEDAPYFLRIKRLSVRARQEDPDMLDITFVLSFYEKT